MAEQAYGRRFFEWAAEKKKASSAAIVPLVLERVSPRSVVDLGCGTGTWLAEFARHGVTDYAGVDGAWVPRDALVIPADRFIEARLDEPLDLGRSFDLAVALEVGEHIAERHAKQFVANIVAHAPCVLFSAAVPHQGGTDHINEQWPGYWAERFAEHGYVVLDAIRPLVWSNGDVLPFYRQNVLMFATPSCIASQPMLARDRERTVENQLGLVHPDLLASVAAHPDEHVRRRSAVELTLGELVAALPTVLARSVRWRLGRLTRPTSRRRRRDSTR